MMGETQHVYVTNDIEPSAQDKDVSFEQFGKKDVGDAFDSQLLEHSQSCSCNGAENSSSFTNAKDKEPHSQREAVIRPQQAGKIDFKSLHSRASFPSENSWGAVKGSPQSPTGKSRARDRNKRSGKGERGHQQLYRLTISNARSNPTIGIAYPQQKVMPPKKVEPGRGPVSGSYRFHVPRIPEREVELQQEDLSFARCIPETTSSHISSNYTSPTAAARPNHGAKMQPSVGIPHESPGSSGQLHYLEFQGNGNTLWHSPDKSLPGTNGGLSAPKTGPFPENNKSNAHCLEPSSFQYPFQAWHSPADSFQGEANAQDYVDISLATSQASHGALPFHSSSRDWKEEALSNGPYENVAPENRICGLAPQLTPFLQSPTPGPLPCYKGRNEHSTDHNGASSPSGAIDQNPSTLQENQAVFLPSLHVSSMPKPIGKRQPSLKDNVASQRILDAGSLLRRNMPQISLSQVHFQNKAYGDPPASSLSSTGPAPFEKNLSSTAQAHPRLLQAWEAGKRPYSPLEQNATPYGGPVGNQLSLGSHSGPEQRQPVKKTWHHLHLTSAVPGQNRTELSRKLAGQELPFPSEWEGNGKVHKGTAGYSGKVLLTGEGAIIQRHDPASQNCSFDGAKEADLHTGCGSRSKPFFFNGSPAVPPASSRLPSSSALVLPPSALAVSPSDSPLPSPAPHPTSGSTCSSLSPLSSSPSSHGFEDGTPLTTHPFFHHPCHPKDGNKPVHISEPLCSAHYHEADPIKAFRLSQEASKDELLYKGLPAEEHFLKPALDLSRGCLGGGFEAEAPPPPYSSHHFLASSLSSASLDQLDVFLTCKQCDQNFSNLSSFLEHRQFCSSQVALQGQAKDTSRGPEGRKPANMPPNCGKHTLGPPLLLLPPPPEPHLQLLAVNKTADFLADGEDKGEPKEDPLKTSQLGNLAPNPLPLSASDLEIDDAKLDSLITEALNGLEYQSDNPEIDSSFIDVFADEELATVKVPGGGAPYKGKKMKPAGMDENVKTGNGYDDHPCGDLMRNRAFGKQQGPKERLPAWGPDQGGVQLEKQGSTELVRSKAVAPGIYDGGQMDAGVPLKLEKQSCCGSLLQAKQANTSFPGLKQPKNVKCPPSLGSDLQPAGEPVTTSGITTKLSAKEAKKRKLRSGTWSKELIHKIVQQKNKLHKMHTKSTKAVPLSLLADRLLPETKDNKFGEYEYISESDDERVEYAKRHCRRKLGSRFTGRLRSSFSRRRQRRGGREKDKEPPWSYRPWKDREEPKSASGKEAGRKDSCVGRLRGRSSRSSTSSCRSTTFSSETSSSSSPQSPELADSDTEKEGEQRKRALQNPEHAGPLSRELRNVPQKETLGRSQAISSDLSREPGSNDSAKILPPVFKAHRNHIPDISPFHYTDEEEGLLLTKENLSPSKATLGKSPNVFFGSEETEQCAGRPSHDEAKPRAPDKALEPCDLGINQHWHPFTAYNGHYHVEELIGPSSTDNSGVPLEETIAYEKAGVKHSEKQKEFIAPLSCFGDNPVGLGTAAKGSNALVNTADPFYDCKELSSSYESPGLFSASPSFESSHGDNIYLCQEDVSISSFKQKPSVVASYEADPSKVPSPLSFDSSSVFGEIPVADFDTTLYDGVSSSKDNYAAFPCTSHLLGKMTPFDQQYSSFLQEKEWSQLVSVSPALPEDLAPFHGLAVEKPPAKMFPNGEISPMPVALPERVADFNEPFMNSISDDDLEIKRLVTELESQLQMSKLSMESSDGHRVPKDGADAERKESIHQFSPLTLEQQSGAKGLFLEEAGFENTGLLSTKACFHENPANKKTLVPDLDTKLGSPGDLWPCSVQFSPLPSSMNTASATDLILVDAFSSRESHEKLHEDLKDAAISEEDGFRETRGDNTEVPSYGDNLIRSPGPLFPKTMQAAGLNTHQALPMEAAGSPELPQKEEMSDGAVKLESHGHQVACLRPESGLQEVKAEEDPGSLPASTQHDQGPEERPSNQKEAPEILGSRAPKQRGSDGPVLVREVKETEGAASGHNPAPGDRAGSGKASLFDSLPFSKELEEEAEDASAPQGKSANPLQQLQLFVARTVKNNEEDLLLPCFPVLHPAPPLPASASVQPEQEKGVADSAVSTEVSESPTLGERMGIAVGESGSKAASPSELSLEAAGQVGHLGEKVSPAAQQLALPGPERSLKDECLTETDLDRCPGGLSPEHSNLALLSRSVVPSLLKEEGAQVTGEQEKAALAFRSSRKSPLRPQSIEQDASDHPLPAVLQIQVTHGAPWGEARPKEQTVVAVKAQPVEPSGDHSQHGTSSAPDGPPESASLWHQAGFHSGISPGLEKQATPSAEVSQESLPVELALADQKQEQENNTVKITLPGFGKPPSQEHHCLTTAPESQPAPLCPRRHSSGEEKGALGSPSEGKAWKEASPFSPILQHCHAPSPLLVDLKGNLRPSFTEGAAGALAQPPKDAPAPAASPLCFGGPTTPLPEKERPLELQTTRSQSPSVPSCVHKDLSEGLLKRAGCEDGNTLSARDVTPSSPPVSRRSAFFCPSPSEIPSTQSKDDGAKPTLLEAKEAESCSPKVNKDESQQEVVSKDVNIQETPAPDLMRTDQAEGIHLVASHWPQAGCGFTSQNMDSGQNDTQKGCEQNKKAGNYSSSNKCGNPKDDSKTVLLEVKRLQVVCDICSISFRSKMGLMRHRAVKHQENKDSAPSVGPGKPASRRNTKALAKERGSSSRTPKTASGHAVPRSYRSRRKEPSAEIQEVVSRVLSDLSVISFDITHELQSTERLSEETKTASAQADESRRPHSRKDSQIGRAEEEAKPLRSGSLAEKRLRKKGKRGKGKGVPNQNQLMVPSRVEKEVPSAVSLTTTVISKEMQNSCTSTESPGEDQPSLLPLPWRTSEPEADERMSSTKENAGEQTPPRDVQSASGKGTEDPELEEKLYTQDRWPTGSPKQVEERLSTLCKGQHDGVNVEEDEEKDSPLEEANFTDHNSLMMLPLGPKSQDQPLDSGPDQTGSIEDTLEKAIEGSPYPVGSEPRRTQDLHPSQESDNGGPDLQSLFDDDATFSQLFPRNDQFARRKCTRVYGKRTKKLKPAAEANTRPEVARDFFTVRMASDLGETSSFCVTREDPCEYETISIDDALMLNMCHGSKTMLSDTSSVSAKNVALQPDTREEAADLKDEDTLSFLCPASQTETLPTLSDWSSAEKEAETASADGSGPSSSLELSSGRSVVEASPEPPDLEEELCEARRNENPSLPEFHTIDMEVLSTKFQTRDVSCYHAGEDRLHPMDEGILDLKPTPVRQGRPIKNKLEEGKQGLKPRSDLNLKTKEKQYKCKVCFQWFLTLGELDFHKLTHNPSPPPTCYMCVQRKFSSREQLRDHLKEKHAKNKAGLWACGMCLKEISDVWMYNEHLREHATQFARKGQAQKSVLGLPGCFSEDDAAVTHFLNSILCRKPSKPSKNAESGGKTLVGKESKPLKEPPGQEGKARKDPSEGLVRIKPPAPSPKAPAASPAEPAPKVEGPSKTVPMHPECKDPSRDCHHCGKQFPKPFKLQRHLVVHSLQKIYLCHKCPMFYQETQELRSHLGHEHGAAEEADIKHTTLYACELCADVMHVIKKSFICSTCNYTFSKKEQYDRHMEKHLEGNSKTFRFRGVMRPDIFPKEGSRKIKEELRAREGTPAAKKKKVLHHNPPPAQFNCLHSPQQGGETPLPPLSAAVPPPQAPLRAEDQMGDFSGLLAESEESPFHCLPLPLPPAPQPASGCPEGRHTATLPLGQPMKSTSPDENPPPFLDSPDAISIDLASLAHKRAEAHKPSPPHLSEKHRPTDTPARVTLLREADHPMGMWDNSRVQEDSMDKMLELPPAGSLGVAEGKGAGRKQWVGNPCLNETAPQESACKLNSPEAAFHTSPLKDKTPSPTLNWPAKEIPSKKATGGQADRETGTNAQNPLGAPGEVQKPPCLKDKAPPDSRAQVGIKDAGTTQVSPGSGHLQSEPGGIQVRHNHSEPSRFQERPISNGLPKKRREHKSSHKGGSASRENIEGDGGKKKKVRGPEATRGEGTGGVKRPDWSSSEALALSPRRRETHCNKLTPKSKVSMTGSQLKKVVLDHQCFQKKAEIRHSNGDLKRKKDVLGKTSHPLTAKDPSPSLASALNRPRAVQGAKLPDVHHYRTAESQNNLLSQLFGQKLTSFKIPLRRDTSE